jgi:hypothetical protein
MSFSICYAMQAWHYPYPDLLRDAKAWLAEQNRRTANTIERDMAALGVSFPRHDDQFVVTAEFGESNLFDEYGKRVRGEWTCHGFLNQRDVVRYLGIRWSEDVESGALKPNGRWSTAESWIKRIKQQLKQAQPVTSLPRYCEKSFYSIPLNALTDKQQTLMHMLTLLSVQQTTGLYGEAQAFRLTCQPKTVFEWWLFCQAVHQLPSEPAVVPMLSIDW